MSDEDKAQYREVYNKMKANLEKSNEDTNDTEAE